MGEGGAGHRWTEVPLGGSGTYRREGELLRPGSGQDDSGWLPSCRRKSVRMPRLSGECLGMVLGLLRGEVLRQLHSERSSGRIVQPVSSVTRRVVRWRSDVPPLYRSPRTQAIVLQHQLRPQVRAEPPMIHWRESDLGPSLLYSEDKRSDSRAALHQVGVGEMLRHCALVRSFLCRSNCSLGTSRSAGRTAPWPTRRACGPSPLGVRGAFASSLLLKRSSPRGSPSSPPHTHKVTCLSGWLRSTHNLCRPSP